MKKSSPPIYITSEDIVNALEKRYPDTAYVTLFEVSDRTGGRNRAADVIILSMWPSRGLDIIGIEIKVHRGDWISELRKPAKAEAFFNFCNEWWVYTAPNIVKNGELPRTWGLIEFDGKRFKVIKKAPSLKPKPVTKPLMMSLIRNALSQGAASVHWKYRMEMSEARQSGREETKYKLEDKDAELRAALKRIQDFERASGLRLGGFSSGLGWHGHDAEDCGKAVRAVLKYGPSHWIEQAKHASRLLSDAAKNIQDTVITELAKKESS